MARTQADPGFKAKDTCSTSVRIGRSSRKKLVVEAKRQEQEGRRRFAIAKRARNAVEEEKLRSKSKPSPEHRLATAFSSECTVSS